ATVEGRFSPSDWEKILDLAEERLGAQVASGAPENSAWADVIRDFHRSRYWGFRTGYRPPREKTNLGLQFIYYTFMSLTVWKVAVLWFGQKFSNGEDRSELWPLLLILAIVIGNTVYFLWRNRAHTDR